MARVKIPYSALSPKPGFDWRRVRWGKPDSPMSPLCALCCGGLPEVPLIMWRPDGAAASFCDPCVGEMFGMKPEEP